MLSVALGNLTIAYLRPRSLLECLRKSDLREFIIVVEVPSTSLNKRLFEIAHKINCAQPQTAWFALQGCQGIVWYQG